MVIFFFLTRNSKRGRWVIMSFTNWFAETVPYIVRVHVVFTLSSQWRVFPFPFLSPFLSFFAPCQIITFFISPFYPFLLFSFPFLPSYLITLHLFISHLYFPWKPLPIVFFRSISSILGIKVHHPTYNINH